MPALPVPQSDWSNNVYVVVTTRVFVMVGMAYLIKSLYHLLPSNWGTRSASIAAVVADGIGLGDITSDTPVTLPGDLGTGLDLEANLTLDVRPPHPSHGPLSHAERPRVSTGAEHQSTEISGSSAAPQTMPEQDIGVRDGDRHIEEDMDLTLDPTG
ncbi:MAG: hypothetical protein ASARMPRED_005096 [Alectoria sarmentosa]|nr:MAG: hypothetical protein ASARMPRED_005096 [Alectoria sarmentosa]